MTMKLNSNFLLHNTKDESILVPTGKAEFSGVVRGNKTFGAIAEILKSECSKEELISAMKERFDGQDETIEKDVEKALLELRKIGAIDE